MNDATRSEPSDVSDAGTAHGWDEIPAETLEKVRGLFVSLGKAVRAHQLYDENNPVYQRFVTGLRDRFRELWSMLDHLPALVEENRLLWEGEEVYRSDKRSDSLAFLFYKDGVREIAFEPGIEGEELVQLLQVLQRARNLRPETDDLLTVLWDADLDHFHYDYVDVLTDGVAMPEPGEGGDQEKLQSVLAEEVEGDEAGVEEGEEDPGEGGLTPAETVRTEDFNPTLYSLDPGELEQLRRELEEEMSRDVRRGVLTALFDRLEEPENPERQRRILGILRMLLPNLLSRGNLTPAAAILHELHAVRRADDILDDDARGAAMGILDEISSEETVDELVRALEDGAIRPEARELETLFRFLRPGALLPLIRAVAATEDPRVREILRRAMRALAERYPKSLVRLLEADDSTVVAGAARLAGAVEAEGAGPRLAALIGHESADVRHAVVEAAVALRASTAASALEGALRDPDRDVRIAAARGLGTLGYRPAAESFRRILESKAIRQADVSEIIAFFESYGRLNDPDAVPLLDRYLNGKSFFGRRESEDIRAAAALALGRIDTPEAREALERARSQENPVVKSAVGRALRGEDAPEEVGRG